MTSSPPAFGPAPASDPRAVRAFASLRVLAWMNSVAVALALAACTSVAIGVVLEGAFPSGGIASGLSTAAFGLVWACLLRHWRRRGRMLQWLASAPLAAANAGVALALALELQGPGVGWTNHVQAFVLGALVGSILWVPALVVTLVVFGTPLHRARQLADKGLAGEEDGERWVGAVSSMLGALAALLSPLAGGHGGVALAAVAGGLAAALGATSAVLATLRQRARERFVVRVESGDVPGYRVDFVTDGKMLVRVVPGDGAAYRVTDFAEEICELDHEGNAVAPR